MDESVSAVIGTTARPLHRLELSQFGWPHDLVDHHLRAIDGNVSYRSTGKTEILMRAYDSNCRHSATIAPSRALQSVDSGSKLGSRIRPGGRKTFDDVLYNRTPSGRFTDRFGPEPET